MSNGKEQQTPRQRVRDEGAMTVPLYKGGRTESTRHMGRRAFLAGLGILGTGAAVFGPKIFNNPSQGSPSPDTGAETIPTNPPSTTAELPTTTLEPKPTDIVEQRDGYGVLRNGGLLYEVESAPWFGGFELHLESAGVTSGFQERTDGSQSPEEFLLESLLWTFGGQHPEFVKPDQQVDIAAYKDYLKANDWVDPEVFLPDNLAEGPSTTYPPSVGKSEAQSLNYKLPFIIGNGDLGMIEGFEVQNPNNYPTFATNFRTLFGITDSGQIYYSLYQLDQRGIARQAPLEYPNPYVTSEELGRMLTVTSRITHPEASSEAQWQQPIDYYWDRYSESPTGVVPPYPVLDIFDFVGFDPVAIVGWEKLFAPTSS